MAIELLCLLLVFSSVVWGKDVPPAGAVEPIYQNPGMYFERLNGLKFIRDEWTYVIYINLYEDQFNEISLARMIKQIEYDCTPRKYCADIEDLTEGLKIQLSRAGRIQRDLLEILNTHPGNLDKDTKFGYIKYINELPKFDTYFTYLPKTKTHIIQSSLDGFRKNKKTGKSNELTHLIAQANNLTIVRNTTKFAQHAHLFIEALESHMNVYIEIFTGAIEVIRSLQNNQLYPGLLEPMKLYELITHTTHLGAPFTFPLSGSYAKIDVLGGISTLKYGKADNNLMITIKFPLVSESQFTLYRLNSLPIPKKINNEKTVVIYIKPRTPLLGVNKNQTYTLSEEQYERCKYTTENLICQQEQPIFIETEANASCEYSLLFEAYNTRYHNCNMRYRESHLPFYTRINNARAWIFSIHEPVTLKVNCRDQFTYFLKLNATGILKLPYGCEAVSDNYQIFSATKGQILPNNLIFPPATIDIQKECPLINRFSEIILSRTDIEKQTNWSFDQSLWELERKAEEAINTEIRQEKLRRDIIIISLGILTIMGLLLGIILTIICFCNMKNNLKANTDSKDKYDPKQASIEVPYSEVFEHIYFSPTEESVTEYPERLPSIPV